MFSFIFDIGGVLVNFSIERLLENLRAAWKCDAAHLYDIFQPEQVYRVETGRISSSEYFTRQVSPVIKEMTYDDWIAAWMENYSLNQPGMKLLKQLQQEGHPIYLLSNLAEHHKIALEKKFPGLFDLCERNFLSYELGLFKPELAIYDTVAQRIGQKPANCVFFDDTAPNVAGANEAGMIGIPFHNDYIETIEQRIRELSLQPGN